MSYTLLKGVLRAEFFGKLMVSMKWVVRAENRDWRVAGGDVMVQGVPRSMCTHVQYVGGVSQGPKGIEFCETKPSMRGPMSSEAVQILCRGLPHIPFAVGFGRSGPSQTCPRTSSVCHPQHIL